MMRCANVGRYRLQQEGDGNDYHDGVEQSEYPVATRRTMTQVSSWRFHNGHCDVIYNNPLQQ
jgi:hypothetical protein